MVKPRKPDVCSMFHYQCSSMRLRKKSQPYDRLMLFQFFEELTAKQFINKSQLVAGVTPFKTIKIFTDKIPIQTEANQSSRTPPATNLFTKSKDTSDPLPRISLDKLPSLEATAPTANKIVVDLDASSSLLPSHPTNDCASCLLEFPPPVKVR